MNDKAVDTYFETKQTGTCVQINVYTPNLQAQGSCVQMHRSHIRVSDTRSALMALQKNVHEKNSHRSAALSYIHTSRIMDAAA